MAASIVQKRMAREILNTPRLGGTPDTSASSTFDESGGRRPQEQHHSNPASDDEFHLTIPAYLMQYGRGLGEMDQDTLAECMKPVMRSLRNLDAETLLGLERVENGARLCDGVNVRPIHDEVYPQYDSFPGISCVRYIHITEVPEQYSIGIFVFPPFSRIPLHDHPEMCVLSRLLYGDLQCLSLDLPDAAPKNTQAKNAQSSYQALQQAAKDQLLQQHLQRPANLPEGSRRAFKNPIKHLHAPDVSLLFPYKGNLHEFFAGPNGAAVLDILLPPYDVEHERDCTFFDIREDAPPVVPPMPYHHQPQQAAAGYNPNPQMAPPANNNPNPQQAGPMLMDIDPSSSLMAQMSSSVANPLADLLAGDDERTPCWIVPTDQPHDFHCLSGKYEKLGNNIIAMQDTSASSYE